MCTEVRRSRRSTTALLDDDAEALYERAPCGYLSTTPDGTIVKVNQTFLTLDRLRPRRPRRSATFADLLTAGGRIYHETHYAPMLQMQGRAREIALDIVRADGTPAAGAGQLGARARRRRRADASSAPRSSTPPSGASTSGSCSRPSSGPRSPRRGPRLLARTLQQTLIPPAPPAVPGLDVAAVYRPAGNGDEVGGDFYDVFECRRTTGSWRSATCAARASRPRWSPRWPATRSAPQRSEAATRPRSCGRSTRSCSTTSTDRFCTVALVRLCAIDGGFKATITSAGHPLTLFARPGAPAASVGSIGTLLGVLPEPRFANTDVELRSGDRLVLFTDGVTEARRNREFFGDDRLCEAVGEGDEAAAVTASRILQSVLDFQRGDPRDDIVVVVLRVP